MVKVIKRDGKMEGFQPAKIIRACKKAGAPEVIGRALAGEVSRKVRNRKTVRSSEIRKIVLDALLKAGKAAEHWKKYKKRR